MTQLLTWLCLLVCALSLQAGAEPDRPNILFIFTDDQDLLLDSLRAMPKTVKLLGEENGGITFTNAFTTTPVCCPSRSALLTGQLLHNNRAINNSLQGNCSSTAWQKTKEINGFSTYLKAAGYSTFFAGKYLNMYGFEACGGPQHIPPGWDDWHGLVGNSIYYGYTISNNGVPQNHGNSFPNDYLPLVINKHADHFIRSHVSKTPEKPFFAMLSLPSCHDPLDAAPKYQDSFPNISSPRPPNYNVGNKGKEWFVASQQKLDPIREHYTDLHYRKRLQTLLTVDDIVEETIGLLKELGVDNNTFVFFSSDNGYHLGEFSVLKDKRLPYEGDIRVPFFIRPPKRRESESFKDPGTSSAIVTLVDLAPTFLDLAGVATPSHMDGKSLVQLINGKTENWRGRFLYEYHGEGTDDSSQPSQCVYHNMSCYDIDKNTWLNPPYWDGPTICHCEDVRNNTYWCVRIIDDEKNWSYCEFTEGNNGCEFYDLKKDPYQLHNACMDLAPHERAQLSHELSILRKCSGRNCFIQHSNFDKIF